MKKWSDLFMILWFVLFSTSVAGQSIAGNEIVKENTRETGDFNSIIVDGGITVFLVPGDSACIRVKTDENLDSVIATKIKDSELRIYPTLYIRYFKTIEVYVTFVKLSSLTALENSELKSDSLLNFDEISISCDQGSKVELTMTAVSINCQLSRGSKAMIDGTITEIAFAADDKSNITSHLQATTVKCSINAGSETVLKGSCETADLSVTNGSKILAEGLKANNCNIKLDIESTAEVYANTNLTVDSKGASDVVYSGNPTKKVINNCEDCEVIAR